MAVTSIWVVTVTRGMDRRPFVHMTPSHTSHAVTSPRPSEARPPQDWSPGCRACPPLPARALHRDLRPDSPSGSWQGQAVDLSAVKWPNPEDVNCLVLSFGDIFLES